MNGTEYSRIVNEYTDTVYRAALSCAKSPADAEDVVQSTFEKLLLRKQGFENEEHVRRWLLRVAVNECNSLWSSFWRRNVSLAETMPETDGSAGLLFGTPDFANDTKRELYEAVMELPGKYRVVIHLFYYEGYSGKEIAKLLHISEANVRTRLVRAREHLKQRLKEEWQDEK